MTRMSTIVATPSWPKVPLLLTIAFTSDGHNGASDMVAMGSIGRGIAAKQICPKYYTGKPHVSCKCADHFLIFHILQPQYFPAFCVLATNADQQQTRIDRVKSFS